MRLKFWPSPKARLIQTRRGKKVYRALKVPPGTGVIEYPTMTLSIIELVEDGEVIGTYEVANNTPRDGMMKDVRPSDTYGRSSGYGASPKDSYDMQQVGGNVHPDGETVSRENDVQVPPVDKGDARLPESEDGGAEGGSGGVHGNDDESGVLQDRSTEGVGSVSSPVEDTGRDGLLVNEVRSSVGTESPLGQDVLGRKEHRDEAGGDSDSVHQGK